MSRNTPSSPSVAEPPAVRGRLPPPDRWPTFECASCTAPMRVPFPPSDGLCGTCRDRQRKKFAKTLEERLTDARVPQKLVAWTRAGWERRYGRWCDVPELRGLDGWPRQHHESSWLVFITERGPVGRRSALGTAVLGEALEQGIPGVRISQGDWLRDIKASWDRRNAEPEHVVWRRAADARVLLFDDFGPGDGFQQLEKSWWRLQVTELLLYREMRRLPTIVTARLLDWRQVGGIHEALVPCMDVPLKIELPPEGVGRHG